MGRTPKERHWTYRVISHPEGDGKKRHMSVHETYFTGTDKAEIDSWTSQPEQVIGEDLKDLKWKLRKMLDAVEHAQAAEEMGHHYSKRTGVLRVEDLKEGRGDG